jgi:hypothetical protein
LNGLTKDGTFKQKSLIVGGECRCTRLAWLIVESQCGTKRSNVIVFVIHCFNKLSRTSIDAGEVVRRYITDLIESQTWGEEGLFAE